MDNSLHHYLAISKRKISAILLIADSIVLTASYSLFHFLRTGSWLDYFSISFLGVYAILILTLHVVDAYRPDSITDRGQYASRALYGTILAGIASTVFFYLLGPNQFTSAFGRGIFPATMISFGMWAAFSRFLVSLWITRTNNKARWLFIGEWEKFVILINEFNVNPKRVGVIIIGDSPNTYHEYHDSILSQNGTLNRLNISSWETIVLSSYESLNHQDLALLMELRQKRIPIYDLTSLYETLQGKIPILHLEKGWFLQNNGFSLLHNKTGIRLKRLMDVTLSLLSLIPAIPIMMVVGLLLRITSPGSILYSQNRIGLHGKIFRIYKFRTMVENSESASAQWIGANDPRITKFGKFLRSSRLDELPQLWNVLKGDMSFIGPRPEWERPEFLHEVKSQIPFYVFRHLVKPGITGWAQVMYPYGVSIEDVRQKLQYDLYYIKNYSVFLDLYILLKTIKVVLLQRGQ